MKLFKNLLAGTLALGMFACSSDEPTGSVAPEPSGDVIYSSVKFRLPVGGRSTGKEGEEVGKDYENSVGSILVVLTTKDEANGEYKYITSAINDAPITDATNNTYTLTFQDKEALFDKAGKDVSIFAFCNPTEEIRNEIAQLKEDEKFDTDAICSADVEKTWSNNGFLMTNVEIGEKTLPEETELKTHNSPSNPYKLGTIEVIRTMSRFDFRDASSEDTDPLTYTITNTETKKAQGSVTLTRVALFNLADKFYYLPRTKASADAQQVLCPGDMEQRFVISPDGRNYTEQLPTTGIDPLNPVAGGLKWQGLSALIGINDNEDKDEGWGTEGDREGYHIWRYATENTFVNANDITSTTATGYVFEAEINVAEDFGNVDEDGNKATMYLFGQTLYASAEAIATEIEKTPVSLLATAFNAAFEKGEDGKYAPVSDEAVKENGFTAYKPNDEGKYLCYYFSYNRHNDDNDVTNIGDLEFATVRNNVYKLAVTKISRFGTFQPSENIEDWDVYFNLEVKVRNWTVRINNIEY